MEQTPQSQANRQQKNTTLLTFGLPIMTTAIVAGSMYIGYLIGQRETAMPRIDVNVPQAAAPIVDVHVPCGPTPTVTVSPQLTAPAINVTPPAATVTIIKGESETREASYDKPLPAVPISAAPRASRVAAAPIIESSKEPVRSEIVVRPERIEKRESFKPVAEETVKPALRTAPSSIVASASSAAPAKPRPYDPGMRPVEPMKPIEIAKPVVEAAKPIEVAKVEVAKPAAPAKAAEPVKAVEAARAPARALTMDDLYLSATTYVESYCRKRGLDPSSESERWTRNWLSGVEQAINDNIDSSEQSYINRMVIAKRDYFNMEKATPERVVEACRIMLRYRDGQLAWLQAMKDAMTQENLRKTVDFLASSSK